MYQSPYGISIPFMNIIINVKEMKIVFIHDVECRILVLYSYQRGGHYEKDNS